MVILTLCLFALFALISQTKQGKETFFAVGDFRDWNEDEDVGAFGDVIALWEADAFVGQGIVPNFATLSFDRAGNKLFDAGLFAGEGVENSINAVELKREAFGGKMW